MSRLKSLPEKTEPSLIIALSSFKSLLTWLGIGLLRLTSYLPYSILMNLGDGIGSLIYKVSPRRREISKINIKLCLDIRDNELNKLVKTLKDTQVKTTNKLINLSKQATNKSLLTKISSNQNKMNKNFNDLAKAVNNLANQSGELAKKVTNSSVIKYP